MGFILGRLREAAREAKRQLGRDPRVSVVREGYITGTVVEIHEDGFVMKDTMRELHQIQPNGTINVMVAPITPLVGHQFVQIGYAEVWCLEEEEPNKLVIPDKRLVVPVSK